MDTVTPSGSWETTPGGLSVSPGQDADAVKAVDLDHLVRANQAKVLASPGLPSLGPSDAKHLDVAALPDDVVAGSNIPGEGHLGLLSWRATLRHHHSLLPRRSALQSWARALEPRRPERNDPFRLVLGHLGGAVGDDNRGHAGRATSTGSDLAGMSRPLNIKAIG